MIIHKHIAASRPVPEFKVSEKSSATMRNGQCLFEIKHQTPLKKYAVVMDSHTRRWVVLTLAKSV